MTDRRTGVATQAEKPTAMVDCPVCEYSVAAPRWRSSKEYTTRRCPDCGLIFLPEDDLVADDLQRLYSGNEVSTADYYLRTREADLLHFSDLFARIERRMRPGKLLDVGCSVGTSLELAQARGWDARGLEPNPRAAELAVQRGLLVATGFLDDSFVANSLGNYDAITISDVLEHVFQPVRMLEHCHAMLADGGVVAVTTINVDSWLCRRFQVKLPEHVIYFSARTLRQALEKAAFRSVEVSPYARERDIASMALSTTEMGGFERLVSSVARAVQPLNRIGMKCLKFWKDELVAIGVKSARGSDSGRRAQP